MKSTIRLFKALPIKSETVQTPSEKLLSETIKRGFLFSPNVIGNYSENELLHLIDTIGLTPEQLNSTFHKSWEKIANASIRQLFLEQIMHYITTYGFEALGCFDKDSVYIPKEELKIPEIEENIPLTIIRGLTIEELKVELMKLLCSGIALKKETIDDAVEIAIYIDLDESEIENIKNKETKMILYDCLNKIPQNPIEFLRLVVYQTTQNSLLIKSNSAIENISNSVTPKTTKLFQTYINKYGMENLARVFYRFKPIFLALRQGTILKKNINRIRRLAVKHHSPMPEDYLNLITAKIRQNEAINGNKLIEELNRVNTFRKIRLLYALKYRTSDVSSILYKIRNGKGYATKYRVLGSKQVYRKVLEVVLNSIVEDISTNVKGKKVYLPENIVYALPATEKQFVGNFPSGSYITVPDNLIVGAYWEDVKDNRIDLDLSLINLTGEKYGWDGDYRSGYKNILFSGDITSAPKGATELFYVNKNIDFLGMILVNYYNYDEDIGVPYTIITAKQKLEALPENYMINPNYIITTVETNINQKQNILGLLGVTQQECRFYFVETSLGNKITSEMTDFTKNCLQYLVDFYSNVISLKDVLIDAGAEFTENEEDCQINLSDKKITKNTILDLLIKK
jgi:hypothetical protein